MKKKWKKRRTYKKHSEKNLSNERRESEMKKNCSLNFEDERIGEHMQTHAHHSMVGEPREPTQSHPTSLWWTLF